MTVEKGSRGALKKPLIVYRLKITCTDVAKEDLCDEELYVVEDILETEDIPSVMIDLHAHYTWLYGEYEIEDMGRIELWSRKDFKHWGKFRGFYKLYGDGSCLLSPFSF
jgi:hypothetical protein